MRSRQEIIAAMSALGIVIRNNQAGEEVKAVCPKCSATRRKKNVPCLSANLEKGVWNCHHCEWSGGVATGEAIPSNAKKQYRRPKPENLGISSDWLDWLKSRGISQKTALAAKVMSGMEYIPQVEAEVDCLKFPYFRAGEIINVKSRDREKHFRLVSGAELLLFGEDDMGKKNPTGGLIWVEGEMDKLSMMEAGLPCCVSVPNGAPSLASKNYAKQFDFLAEIEERLSCVEKHIIAVDADAPGRKLQEELIRRLGPEKCVVVCWPEGAKDANEHLVKYGAASLLEFVVHAKPCPVEGIVHAEDLRERIMGIYEDGQDLGARLGWACVDELYRVREKEFCVVTGIPNHGKSEWLDAALVLLSEHHGWRHALFSPENHPIEQHITKLIEKHIGKSTNKNARNRASQAELDEAISWVDEHFSFLAPESESPTVDAVLERFRVEILRRGVKGLVIDPWNEIEHRRPGNMSETEYISEVLTKLRRFARKYNCHLWIVAHPTKLQKERDGTYPVPRPYDISGSANWMNKADVAIAVFRHVTQPERPVEIHVQKIRFKASGRVGMAELAYDLASSRYFDPMAAMNQNHMYRPEGDW